tara:strand:+ start:15895 stop:17076 length:1182 start_codon:yes stop_codon:yes gene_type:complete
VGIIAVLGLGVCVAVGVIRFDDPAGVGAGWASYNGESAFRIRSIGDLDTSKQWIVDMIYPAYRNAKLWNIPHIKRMDYLRVKPGALALELGIDGNTSTKLEKLSGIYGKTAQILTEKYGIDLADPSPTASHALKSKNPPPTCRVSPKFADAVANAVIESTQESQNGTGKSGAGTVPIGASYPRGAYAAYLLSQPVPTNVDWSPVRLGGGSKKIGVHNGKSVRGTEDFIEKLKSRASEDALFFEVTVLSMPAQFAKHSTFGVGANTARRWATLPEIVHLSNFAYLELSGGFRTGMTMLDQVSDHIDPTISGGIAAEIDWVSRCLPRTQDGFNPIGAYLRAYDRVACASAANELAAAGYQIASFGTGRVFVYANPNDSRLDEHFLRVGLMPRPIT